MSVAANTSSQHDMKSAASQLRCINIRVPLPIRAASTTWRVPQLNIAALIYERCLQEGNDKIDRRAVLAALGASVAVTASSQHILKSAAAQ